MDKYTQEFRIQGDVLHVRLGGTFPNERLSGEQNLFQPLVEACAKNDCRKVMVDARHLTVDFNTLALFRAGVDASALNQFGLRVALVAPREEISPFFDDVIHNRAAPVQVFTDLEAANSWLNASH